jgi:phage baseplate assembly protein W
MKSDPRKAYLGQGLAFPLQINPRGELGLASSETDIEQSIRIILGTRPGERVMRPEFGCNAHNQLFEPRNATTATLIEHDVVEALERWEPRITLTTVSSFFGNEQNGTILVQIEYQIKDSHDKRSIVYPFFLVGQENW